MSIKRKRNATFGSLDRLSATKYLRGALLGNLASSPKSDDGLDAAKSIALVLMLINHVLFSFPDWRLWGNLIGRPCIPIFAFIVVARLANGPPDRSTRMLVRLLFWGLVAQLPYYALLSAFVPRLNILFSLAAGACLIHLARRGPQILLLPAVLLLVLFDRHLDGGALTPIGMLVGYILLRWSSIAALSAVTIAAMVDNLITLSPWPAIAGMTLIAIPMIHVSPRLKAITPRLPSLTFYIFYPAHLLVIWLLLGPFHP